jgi:hypothetical protein
MVWPILGLCYRMACDL